MKKISIKPLLEKEAKIRKFIKIIDKNRYYSNFGPLYYKATKLLEKKLKVHAETILLTSSGHSSLQACCNLVKTRSKKKYIILPSFCFYSNPQAIIQSGFEPYFADINLDNFTLNEKEIEKIIKNTNSNVAAIMFVSPMGFPISIDRLNQIKKKYNLEIIYDAADTFLNLDNVNKANFLITVSFHPTKNLPANESGMVICKKKNIKILKSMISFGFDPESIARDAKYLGFNGKLSEYDAAILLANLQSLERKNKIKKNSIFFLKNFLKIGLTNLILIKNFGQKWSSNKVCMYHKNISTNKIRKILIRRNIFIFSPWNKRPMHMHSLFQKYKKTKLLNTLSVYKKIFAIPLPVDLKSKDILRVVDSLRKIN
jgi:dTDP-4-amino-4,6-dideoxygalactose transaminase